MINRGVGKRRAFAVLVFVFIGAAAGGCDREEGVPLTLTSENGGEGFVPVDYELTSDNYKKWLVAQERLKQNAGDADLGQPADRILLTNPSAESIDGVVRELESNDRTRDAIKSAGLDVRDYVLTTLALYQASDRQDTLGISPGGVPIRASNIELASLHRDEISTARASSRVRIVDDSPRARGNGKAKGKGKGGKGKGGKN